MKALSLALLIGATPIAALAQAPAHDHGAMTAAKPAAAAPAPAAGQDHAGMNHGAGGATAMSVPSSPADGSTVAAPSEISLTFPHAMKLASLRLTDDLGQSVDIGFKPGPDAVQVAKASLPKLAPGRYEARWEGAADGHSMGGTVRFTVR